MTTDNNIPGHPCDDEVTVEMHRSALHGGFERRERNTIRPSTEPQRNSESHDAVRIASASECEVDEDQMLHRRRLSLSTVVTGLGFLVCSLWYLAAYGVNDTWTRAIFVGQIVVVASLLGCHLYLRKQDGWTRWKFQLLEIGTFGVPAILLALWQRQYMISYAGEFNLLPEITPGWMLLIFTYAMFIPNTWQRAAVSIGVIAIMPIAMAVGLIFFHPVCSAAENANFGYLAQVLLKMGIVIITSLVGVATIGGLRREATSARELGRYVLRDKLGEGGMGEVYLAEHRRMRRPCAIKLIRPAKAGDPKTLARFEREVKLSARLSHWNNIDIYDYGRAEDGSFFYVMEFLPGLTLRELVDRFGPMPSSRVIHILRQICSALNEAHGVGLIHRDIKPSNIIASHRGGIYDIAKLLDFGLAKPLFDSTAPSLSAEATIAGSPRFMAPEQATGGSKPDRRSDIYSVGCVAYFMLTGRPPFEDSQPIQAIMAHVSKSPDLPSDHADDVPEDLEQIVMRCLEKDPKDRFQSAIELRQALSRCELADAWSDEDADQWWNDDVGWSDYNSHRGALSSTRS